MKLVIIEKNKVRINKLFDWFLYMIGYTLVFFIATSLFKSVHITGEHKYLIYCLTVLIIYLLNKTVKPILVTLTIPITGLTLGLFYPFINLFILKLVDWILGKHFQLYNFWIALLVSILLSIINIIMDKIIKHLIRGVKGHE